MTRPVLHSLEQRGVPSGSEVRVLEATGGVRLRLARWPAPAGTRARGTIFLLHGYTEFIEKYYEVIDELRARGWAVATFDWRGQGLSSRLLPHPYKGHVEDFADFVEDARQIYEQLVRSEMPRPHVLVGHSMGGHVALRFLEDHPGRFERAVLSAPMLGWDRPPLGVLRAIATAQTALGRGTSYTWLRGDPDPANPVNEVTSCERRFARNQAFLEREPGLRLGGPTWRWLREATSSIARVLARERLIRVKTPVLVASAERDRVVSSALHRALPFLNPAFTAVPIEGSMHEILQETDEVRARFWAAFDRFTS